MSQNRSTAVMQRRVEPHDSLDDFPTPPWATRAVCEQIEVIFGPMAKKTCREPAANRGHMVRPLQEFFSEVIASDVHDYGAGYPVQDYLMPIPENQVDWTISNPPFRLAEQFIAKALRQSRQGVAMIVRSAFLEGQGRYDRVFKHNPPAFVFQFTERVVMHKGRLAPEGSTATAYSWLIWAKKCSGTSFGWIAPCRKRLERAEDYRGQE